jgi:Anti-sigma factor NepR
MSQSKTIKRLRRVWTNEVPDAIGRTLKAHYDDLVKAPLSERFVELRAKLESEERARGSSPS